LRTDAQRPSPVLIHLNADDLGRLVPVKIYISRIWRLAEQGSEVLRNLADLHWLGTADAELERPADRRTKLQGADAPLHLLELRPVQCGDDTRLHGRANLESLRDYDALREEVVRELLVERQIEANGAAADIKGPVLDVRVGLEDFLEVVDYLARRGD
jgi:hypothetical protein